jgi:colicin import membrane protein
MFAAAAWSPTSANYCFYGSGTAVSLVGADQIPGGSARGKSGDRIEDFQLPPISSGPKARKIEAEPERKKPKKKIRTDKKRKKKKAIRKKKRKKRKSVRRKKKKRVRKISLKKKKRKKKLTKRQLARRRKLKRRRDRLMHWRRRQKRKSKNGSPPDARRTRPAPDRAPLDSGELLARNAVGERPKPRVGYLGEGGGDGQGGGSLGGGSGGVARRDIERYYGLLAARVKSNWSIPSSLAGIKSLKTEVIFDVSRLGKIRGLRIEKSSGNRIYDDAVLRAVARSANPYLPPPPNTVKEKWLPLGFRFCGQTLCR